MNKVKKRLLIIIILLVVIIISLFMFINIAKLENINNGANNNEANLPEDEPLGVRYEVKKVITRDWFYIVENCAQNYISYVAEKNTNALISILDEQYVKENSITKENVLNILENFNTNNIIQVNELYIAQDDYDLSTYFLKGNIIDIQTQDVKEFNLIVRIDIQNNSYSVLPEKYMKEKDLINLYEGKQINNFTNKIQLNKYNEYQYVQMTEAKTSSWYLKKYNTLMLYEPERAYKLLEEEYKNIRFPTIEIFNNYINDNKLTLQDSIVIKYDVVYEDDYTQYTIIDNKGNYYIINEKDVLDYTIQLDNYTIKTEKFIEEYKQLTDTEKVNLNVNQFIAMVNSKDYTGIYKLLEDNFKNINFSSEETLEQFLKQNYYSYNMLSINNIEKIGNAYVCDVNLKSGISSAAETTTKKIYIYLQEGTDFKVAFDG